MTHKEKVHQMNLSWNRVPCIQSSSKKACHAIYYNILKGELRQNDLDEIPVTQKTHCEPQSECNYQEVTPVPVLDRFIKCSSSRSLSMTNHISALPSLSLICIEIEISADKKGRNWDLNFK